MAMEIINLLDLVIAFEAHILSANFECLSVDYMICTYIDLALSNPWLF